MSNEEKWTCKTSGSLPDLFPCREGGKRDKYRPANNLKVQKGRKSGLSKITSIRVQK